MTGNEPLSRKVFKGGFWIFSLRFVSRLLGFIRTIILARLLSPHDFGLLGIAMLVIYALETFTQTGFHTALIRKQDDSSSDLDTIWTVNTIRVILLFLLLYPAAPFISDFFNAPESAAVIRVVAFSMILTGLRNPGIVYFQKKLEFDKIFKFELPSALVDLAVSVALAFILESVWALVWGGLAGNIFRLIMSFVLHPYRPRFHFHKDRFRELFGFGKWVLGSSILIYIVGQADNFFVGKMIGVAALGLYQIALTISYLPSSEISYVISQITYPAYSALQSDRAGFRDACLKVLKTTVFCTALIVALIFSLIDDFTQLFLGPKWIAAVPIIKILVFSSFSATIIDLATPIFLAIGKPRLQTFLQFIRLAVLAGTIYPLSLWSGISGVAFSALLSFLFSSVVGLFMIRRSIQCSIRQLIEIFLVPSLGAIVCIVIMFIIHELLGTGLLSFSACSAFGISSYILFCFLVGKRFNYEINSITTHIFQSLRSV